MASILASDTSGGLVCFEHFRQPFAPCALGGRQALPGAFLTREVRGTPRTQVNERNRDISTVSVQSHFDLMPRPEDYLPQNRPPFTCRISLRSTSYRTYNF
jgi:hypothetical protein